MATNGYPHLVFLTPDCGLDKEATAQLLRETLPGAAVEDKPLRLDAQLEGYTFSLWFEDAEGVADRYATYLPEGARRRWLSRCETMIDLHGGPDPEGAHAGQAQALVAALQAREGVEVFSEQTRRFVGMEYGDAAAASTESPGAASLPAEPAEPVTQWVPTVPEPAAAPSPAPVDVPAEQATAPEPEATPVDVPAEQPEPAPAPEPEAPEGEGEKKGLFKRWFGRR